MTTEDKRKGGPEKGAERYAIVLEMRECLNTGAQAQYFALEKKLAELEANNRD